MDYRRIIRAVLSIGCLLLVGATGVPTTPQIRQMLADKQYKRVLREVARAMSLRGDDAVGYDRGELTLIRADAQLAMRIEPAAAKAYRDAAEAATRDEGRATARARAVLMSKSEHLEYTPVTGKGVGRAIDIVNDRKPALEALLADELATLGPTTRSSRDKSTTIPDVLDAAKALEPIGDLERVVTGSRKRVDAMMTAYADQVGTLLEAALVDLDRQADAIENTALTLVVLPPAALGGKVDPKVIKGKKRGLAPGDQGALKSIMDQCREIVSRNREVAMQLGAEADRFHSASDYAIRISAKASDILHADYSGIVERPRDKAGDIQQPKVERRESSSSPQTPEPAPQPQQPPQ